MNNIFSIKRDINKNFTHFPAHIEPGVYSWLQILQVWIMSEFWMRVGETRLVFYPVVHYEERGEEIEQRARSWFCKTYLSNTLQEEWRKKRRLLAGRFARVSTDQESRLDQVMDHSLATVVVW